MTIHEHHLTVARTARYFTLGEPGPEVEDVWFVCHGYGQLAQRFLSQFAALDDGTRLIVAPEALSRFYLDPVAKRRAQEAPKVGATWMTREARDAEIDDYVAYLDQLATETRHHLTGAGPRIVVLGFSQGAATVCRWMGASDLRADQIVLWSGGIPPELDLAEWSTRLHGASLTLVAGEADQIVSANAVAAEGDRLSSAGVAFTLVRHDAGHVIDEGALVKLAEGFEGH